MDAQDSIAIVQHMTAAWRAHDESAYIACFAENAVLRQAGVPGDLGGAVEGRAAILAALHRLPARPEIEVRQIFADDHGNVCVLRRLAAPSFPGEHFFTAAE